MLLEIIIDFAHGLDFAATINDMCIGHTRTYQEAEILINDMLFLLIIGGMHESLRNDTELSE